jgi:ATP-binding cassette subfamily G (WHITE) protein 2 (SNQ2)
MCLGEYLHHHSTLKVANLSTVLGVPGSGCTTFLKAITNQRDGYADVSGEVLYAGISAEEMTRRYRGEVVFNHEGKTGAEKL